MTRRGQEGTSTGAAGMDVDQEIQGRTTPPGTPFDDDFKDTASKGAPTVPPPARVHTKNFYTLSSRSPNPLAPQTAPQPTQLRSRSLNPRE